MAQRGDALFIMHVLMICLSHSAYLCDVNTVVNYIGWFMFERNAFTTSHQWMQAKKLNSLESCRFRCLECDQLYSHHVHMCTGTVQYVYGVYVSSVRLVCKWLRFKMAVCV